MSTAPQRRLTDREARLLAGLADGALDGRRLREAEALAAELPDAAERLGRQRRVRSALAAGPEPAVMPVVHVVPAAPARRMLWARPAAAVALACAAIAAVLLAWQPGGGPPPVASIAQISTRDPDAPAPAVDGPLLRASHAGVDFPEWEREFGWRAIGERRDRVDGRDTRSVFYEHLGHRIAYSVVDGPPLEPPVDARRVVRGGVEIALFRDPRHGGHDVAVFERDGRTCVLAGHVMRVDTLVKLAAWKGSGTVTF